MTRNHTKIINLKVESQPGKLSQAQRTYRLRLLHQQGLREAADESTCMGSVSSRLTSEPTTSIRKARLKCYGIRGCISCLIILFDTSILNTCLTQILI